MTTVIDPEWAARVSRESWASRAVTKSLRRRKDAAAEYLSATHARKVSEAVSYVEQGSDVLRAMVSGTESEVPPPGAYPRAESMIGTTHVRINRGVAEVDPAAASRAMQNMDALKEAIIKDAVDVFATVAEHVGAKRLPENSAAFATVQDVVSVCLKMAGEIIREQVTEIQSRARTK